MNVSLNVVSGVVTLAAASKSKEVAFDNVGSSAVVALKGLAAGLSALNKQCTVRITVDSKQTVRAIKEWLPNWINNGFINSKGESIKDAALWAEFVELCGKHNVYYAWEETPSNTEGEAADVPAVRNEAPETVYNTDDYGFDYPIPCQGDDMNMNEQYDSFADVMSLMSAAEVAQVEAAKESMSVVIFEEIEQSGLFNKALVEDIRILLNCGTGRVAFKGPWACMNGKMNVIKRSETRIRVMFNMEIGISSIDMCTPHIEAGKKLDIPLWMFKADNLVAMFTKCFYNKAPITGASLLVFIAKMCHATKDFKTYLEKMSRNDTLVYSSGDVKTDVKGKEVIYGKWKGLANPELYTTDLYAKEISDTVFAVERNGVIHTPNALTKLAARLHSIGYNKPILSTAAKKVAVVLDTDNQYLQEVFATGSLFVAHDILEVYGMSRVVSKRLGLKGATAPMTVQMSNAFLGAEVLAHAGCVKAGIRGVYAAITGASFEDVMFASNEKVLSTVEANTKMVSTPWGKLEVVFVNEVLDITNLYSLEGWKFKDSEEDEVEDEDASFFTEALCGMQMGLINSLPQYILDNAKEGRICMSTTKTSLKFSSMQNMLLSYGRKDTEEFLGNLKSDKKLESHFKKEAIVYSDDDTRVILGSLSNMLKGKINPGSITPDAFKDPSQYEFFMDVLLNGGDLYDINGDMVRFAGVLCDSPFILQFYDVKIGNTRKFRFPGKSAFKGQFFEREKGFPELGYNLGPIADEFLMLFIAFRNEHTDWAIKEARFNASIGKEIFQDAFSDFGVKGRYLTSLPRTWGGEVDTCTTTSRLFKGLEYVTMSKQPVMFDKAITTLKQDRRLPKKVFGPVSELLAFALEAAVFIDPLLMIRQGNDADGDKNCITDTAMSSMLYTGQDIASKYWDAYQKDEMGMNLKTKSLNIKQIPASECDAAMEEAYTNKSNVGMFTTELFHVQHHLDWMLTEGYLDQYTARCIKEAFALTIQDEAVRAIKHESNTSLFSKISPNAVALELVDFNEAVRILKDTIEKYTGLSIDMKLVETFYQTMIQNMIESNSNTWRTSDINNKKFVPSLMNGGRGNSYTLHAMFIRSTWDKWMKRARAMHKDTEVAKWLAEDTHNQSILRMWTMRLNNGNALINMYDVAEGEKATLVEVAYRKAYNQFSGK